MKLHTSLRLESLETCFVLLLLIWPPHCTTQVWTLAGRLGRHASRHPLLIGLNLVASAAMALGIGAIYWDTGRDTGGIQVGIGAIYWDTGMDMEGTKVGNGLSSPHVRHPSPPSPPFPPLKFIIPPH